MELLYPRKKVHLQGKKTPTTHPHHLFPHPRHGFRRPLRAPNSASRAGHIVLADRYLFTALARDAVRGVDRDWVKELYSFAVHPDITFYFRVPLEVSLNRILEGRPTLKYHEAGLDMGWSTDPYESFRMFQGKVHEEYEKMAGPFGFTLVDATEEIHQQQAKVRQFIREKIDLPTFRRRLCR